MILSLTKSVERNRKSQRMRTRIVRLWFMENWVTEEVIGLGIQEGKRHRITQTSKLTKLDILLSEPCQHLIPMVMAKRVGQEETVGEIVGDVWYQIDGRLRRIMIMTIDTTRQWMYHLFMHKLTSRESVNKFFTCIDCLIVVYLSVYISNYRGLQTQVAILCVFVCTIERKYTRGVFLLSTFPHFMFTFFHSLFVDCNFFRTIVPLIYFDGIC